MEKEFGVEPGALLSEMHRRVEEVGDWRQHLSYDAARRYYDDTNAQALFASHVDACGYCQQMLESFHPTRSDISEFARSAVHSPLGSRRTFRWARFPQVVTWASSLVVVALTSIFYVTPELQTLGWIRPSTGDGRLVDRLVVDVLKHPGRLSRLESSEAPGDRYRAASFYFAADKPQLAWQQIGEGLQLAGVYPVDAQRIKTAADVPKEESAAADIASAARRLPTLEADRRHAREPTEWLERAESQAKLGLNEQALSSIERYLKAAHVAPRALADFSEAIVTEPGNVSAAMASLEDEPETGSRD